MQMHAEDAQISKLADKFSRKRVTLEPLGDVRQNAIAHEGAHGVPEHSLFVFEQSIDVQEVERTRRR